MNTARGERLSAPLDTRAAATVRPGNVLLAIQTTFAILTGLCALGVLASLVRGPMPTKHDEFTVAGASGSAKVRP